MKLRVIVATHKTAKMPSDAVYLPLHVGAAGKEDLGYQRDDEGENISEKNPYYCELTGLYWAWKNLDATHVGLVHYRRHFGHRRRDGSLDGVFSGDQLCRRLEESKVLLPKPRRYYIETLYQHYCHTLHGEVLDLTGEILKEKYPIYYPQFCRLKKRRSGHMFNMMIMPRPLLDSYCTFLFSVLEELEKRVPKEEFSHPFHRRFPGRISELLLDVYLNTCGIKAGELPIFQPDGEKWGKKIAAFLSSKFFGKKYDKSF